MSGTGEAPGQVTMPSTDPGTLAQQLKSQLFPSNKVLNKNQRKKARKKVTKILQKTLGVCTRADAEAADAVWSDDNIQPSSQDTGCCSNRRAGAGVGGTDGSSPARTSNPQRAKQSVAPQMPGTVTVQPYGSGRARTEGDGTEAMPPPKRRRIEPPKRSSSGGGGCDVDGVAAAATAAGPSGAKAAPAPAPPAAAQFTLDTRRKGIRSPWPDEGRPGAAVTAGSSGLTCGGSRSIDGSGGGGGGVSSMAAALSGGGSSRLSHGAQKRLSRRQAQPEDLLTADYDGDDAARGQGGDGDEGAEKMKAGVGKGWDRRQRGRGRELRRRHAGGESGDGVAAATAPSEEVIQIPPRAGTAAAAAATAAAAAVYHGGSYNSFTAAATTAIRTAPLLVRGGGVAAMGPHGGLVTTAIAAGGSADLSAALLMMRVQLRAAAEWPATVAAAAIAADAAADAAALAATAAAKAAGSAAAGGTCSSNGLEHSSEPGRTLAGFKIDEDGTGAAVSGAVAAAAMVMAVAAVAGPADGQTLSSPQQQKQKKTAHKKPQRSEQEAAVRASLYRHGNYHRYYGYRLGADLDEDPRVKLMRPEWFQNRACIDVGCNEGLVTLAVAARFGAKRMIGYDIDATLIKKACRNLRIMRSQYTTRLHALTLGRPGGGGGGGDGAGWGLAEESGAAVSCEGGGSAVPSAGVAGQRYDESHGADSMDLAGSGAGNDAGGGLAAAPAAVWDELDAADGGAQGEEGGGEDDDGIDEDDVEGEGEDDGGGSSGGGGASHHGRQGYQRRPAHREREQELGQGQKQGQQRSAAPAPPLPRAPRRGPHCAAGPAPLRAGVLRAHVKSLAGTRFVQQDWANARGRPDSIDTILCLSVTKWVHLNNGDPGLKRLFKKFYETLAPGGLLVLEPQPWKSYRRAVHKTTTNAVPFKRIEQLQLRPQHFADYLTSQVGFQLEARLNEGEGVGFDRPMFLFRKPPVAPPGAAAEAGREGGGNGGGGGLA